MGFKCNINVDIKQKCVGDNTFVTTECQCQGTCQWLELEKWEFSFWSGTKAIKRSHKDGWIVRTKKSKQQQEWYPSFDSKTTDWHRLIPKSMGKDSQKWSRPFNCPGFILSCRQSTNNWYRSRKTMDWTRAVKSSVFVNIFLRRTCIVFSFSFPLPCSPFRWIILLHHLVVIALSLRNQFCGKCQHCSFVRIWSRPVWRRLRVHRRDATPWAAVWERTA